MNYESILIEPVLSEKANILREEGKYVFKVDPRA
ncbi:MAG: 50S ribosomal protein L23, partial [Treponema sp.]|nr:50S ribosomal protein L23 [Treponema sp.]